MQRISTLVLLALGLLAMLLAACTNPQPTPTPTATPAAAVTTPAPAVPDHTDAWQRIQSAGRIVVGVSADYPPFESYDANFQLDGFDIALMKAIGEKLGVEVEFNDFAFDGLFGALQIGQADAAISAISETPERRELVDFSDVYFISHGVALGSDQANLPVIASVEDLRGLRVAVEGGTIFESWARDELLAPGIVTEADLHVYTDVEKAVKDVQRGLVDVVLLDLQPALAFTQQGGVKIVAEMSAQPTNTPAPQPTATPRPQPPVIDAFSVDPQQISAGQCVNIHWSFSGTDLVAAQLFRNGEVIGGDLAPLGVQQDCPPVTGSVEYRIQVDSETAGSAQRTAQVNVVEAALPPQITSFLANPPQIGLADTCTTLTWTVSGSGIASVSLTRTDQDGSVVMLAESDASSPFQDCVDASLAGQTLIYTLTVSSEFGGSGSQTLPVVFAAG